MDDEQRMRARSAGAFFSEAPATHQTRLMVMRALGHLKGLNWAGRLDALIDIPAGTKCRARRNARVRNESRDAHRRGSVGKVEAQEGRVAEEGGLTGYRKSTAAFRQVVLEDARKTLLETVPGEGRVDAALHAVADRHGVKFNTLSVWMYRYKMRPSAAP